MKKIVLLVAVLAGITIGIIGWIAGRIIAVGWSEGAKNADVIVVLGAAQYDGVPSPIFQARLDHAADLYNQKYASLIITTGSGLAGDLYSEAQAGKTYLINKGIPAAKIMVDDASSTTKQNLTRVASIAKEQGLESIIIVSDPFHLYRARIIAEDLGLSVFTSPTRTSPIEKKRRTLVQFIAREVVLILGHMLFDI